VVSERFRVERPRRCGLQQGKGHDGNVSE
jgi:hypothetical protein